MTRELREAVRELRLDPSQPVFVLVGGMVVELRASSVATAPRPSSALADGARATEIQAHQREWRG